jgi:hypothetical protein
MVQLNDFRKEGFNFDDGNFNPEIRPVRNEKVPRLKPVLNPSKNNLHIE